MNFNVEIINLSELNELAKDARKKAEELQETIQRLNDIELKISVLYDK